MGRVCHTLLFVPYKYDTITHTVMNTKAVGVSGWLASHVRAEDEVIMWMDVGGREHELLSRMLLDDTLLLVDTLHVKWHMQHLVRLPLPTRSDTYVPHRIGSGR